nr:hypothetical protein [Tanacetum cinerariifolium]GEW51254.1 hypothetical protein [Tanacetum cinerariifolium]
MGDAYPIRTLGVTPNLATRATGTPLNSLKGTMRYLFDLTSSGWCKTDAHSTYFDARLSKFEADFKQQQSEITNKIDTVLKVISDRLAGALPSDTVKNLKNSSYLGLRKKYRLSLKNDMPPRDKSIETEFPAIVFNDELSSEKTLSCEHTVSSLNNNETDFRISFDKSDDEDYTISIRRIISEYSVSALRQKGMGLYTAEEIESVGFDAYSAKSARQIPDKDPMLRLCHRLIACSIVGRSQAHKRYLRLFASGRKRMVMISKGQFVTRLAEHFELLTKGLTMILLYLLVIDMGELVRLQICEELDDTWAWVAPGPERLARVEEEVHEIQGELGE